MTLVRCIEERKTNKKQIKVGKLYWLDETTVYKDTDDTEYGDIYKDEGKTKWIGVLNISHFKTEYRYILYGLSLSTYINSDIGCLLKDIISWCISNPSYGISSNLLLYIKDNKLDKAENMEKEYLVKSVGVNVIKDKKEYERYMGYSLEERK